MSRSLPCTQETLPYFFGCTHSSLPLRPGCHRSTKRVVQCLSEPAVRHRCCAQRRYRISGVRAGGQPSEKLSYTRLLLTEVYWSASVIIILCIVHFWWSFFCTDTSDRLVREARGTGSAQTSTPVLVEHESIHNPLHSQRPTLRNHR